MTITSTHTESYKEGSILKRVIYEPYRTIGIMHSFHNPSNNKTNARYIIIIITGGYHPA